MRQSGRRDVRRLVHLPLVHVEAGERFLAQLAGVDDPEDKRKIIGEEFIRVFEEEARRLGNVPPILVQGTLLSDVIESGGEARASRRRSSPTTTSVDFRRTSIFELVEPLRMLFKDEVRRVGGGAWSARGNGLAPAVPGPRPGDQDHR